MHFGKWKQYAFMLNITNTILGGMKYEAEIEFNIK